MLSTTDYISIKPDRNDHAVKPEIFACRLHLLGLTESPMTKVSTYLPTYLPIHPPNDAGDVHNDAGDVNNDTGDANNDTRDVHNDSGDYHDDANDVRNDAGDIHDGVGVIDGDVGDVNDITQPFLNDDVLELIIKITLSTFPLIRSSLKRVSRVFKATVDNVPCPRVYIPELPEELVVISIRKIIMLKGKCSGAVEELREAIKSPRWHKAWIKLVPLEHGWFAVAGIYWKNRLI